MKMILSILLSLSLLACGNDMNSHVDKMSSRMEESSGEALDLKTSPTEQAAPIANQITSRQLIKEGSISFECDNVQKTKIAVELIVKSLGAYTSNEGQDSYGEQLNYRLTIRVPAAKFDSLLNQLERLATKVDSKDINTRDVTEEFIDLDTRLKTKKELENRYLEILKQARNVQEVLAVEREIGNVRSEIESMEGRLNYIKDQVALSTLSVNYYQLVPSNFGFASKFMKSFSNGWENLLSFLIGTMNLWPFIILIGLIVGLYLRQRKAKKA